MPDIIKNLFSKPRNRRSTAAFSLVEILVAITILMIIVVIFSMVFQQTSGAYQSGMNRVKATMEMRAVIGAIERDLVMAVDVRNYPGLGPQVFDGELAFAALTGSASGGKPILQWIQINSSGNSIRRSCSEVKLSGGQFTTAATTVSTLNPEQPLTANFRGTPHPDDPNGLPLRVEIDCRATTRAKISSLSARSKGKDGRQDTKDDIVVGTVK